jgi:hypothetical protein
MRYTICLHGPEYSPTPSATIVSIDELLSKPDDETVQGVLSRSAKPHARVLSVFPQLLTDYSEIVKGAEFSLKSIESFDHENKTIKSKYYLWNILRNVLLVKTI